LGIEFELPESIEHPGIIVPEHPRHPPAKWLGSGGLDASAPEGPVSPEKQLLSLEAAPTGFGMPETTGGTTYVPYRFHRRR
jgi:hypothetical protein